MKKHFITILIIANLLKVVYSDEICNIHCDGRDPSLVTNTRVPVTAELLGRHIQLFISDEDNMGYAEISMGQPQDEIWIDRSMDGGRTFEGKLGTSSTPLEATSVQTPMFNIDNPSALQIGALRACGKSFDNPLIHCTTWARSTVHAETQVHAGATAMMQYFNGNLWSTTGWWNAANCLTAMIDFFKLTGSETYRYVIEAVFSNNIDKEYGNFTNMYIDDTLWWGLAWIDAYDLTGNTSYLEMARFDADFAYNYTDDVCNGGIYWTTRWDHKNAIPNELFIKTTASLHNRIPGDTEYLRRALEVWSWFNATGLINSDNLINDGLNTKSDCQNNGDITWSYNQGVIIGGLVQLHIATGEIAYLDEAREIADAVMSSPDLIKNGILWEFGCESEGEEGGPGDCGGDGASFKGAFIRNLGELDRHLEGVGQGRPYKEWIVKQAEAIWDNNRNSLNQFGLHWGGPFNEAHAGNHHSAFEAFIAAL